MFFILWIACILFTAFFATEKNRSVAGWVVFSLFTGPLALVIIAVLPSLKSQPKPLAGYYGPEVSSVSLKLQLEEAKKEIQGLNNKLNNLEIKIGALRENDFPAEPSPAPVQPKPAPVPEPVRTPPVEGVLSQRVEGKVSLEEYCFGSPAQRKDLEMDLGKFWLNKIGIVIFALGIGFLITYAFKYFGPFLRVIFGYAVCCALFFLGVNLEKKDKFIYFGRVLLGGAWALTYFTTYAMYHFEASKIISSQFWELLLLAIVAGGMIRYSLRYKSEVLTAIAFFVGYLTSTLGDINYFTLISSSLLSGALIFLVYRLQWTRLIFLGIALTYLTHLAWVVKHIAFSTVPVGLLNVENIYFLLDAGFLSIYWFLFAVAVHAIKDQAQEAKLSAANFANFSFYFLMIFPKLYVFYPAQKLIFVLGMGAIYLIFSGICELAGRRKLCISNIVIAVALLTMAVPLKFIPYHTTIIWFIELPFLLFIGLAFRRPVYRYLSFVLAIVLFYKFMFVDSYGFVDLIVFNKSISWLELLLFTGAISMAVSYGLYRIWRNKLELGKELNLGNFFSGFAVFYLTRFLWVFSHNRWLTFNIFAEALLVLICGALLLDKYLRFYSLAVLFIAGFGFCFIDNYYASSEVFQTFQIVSKLILAFSYYAIYRRLRGKELVSEFEGSLGKFLFFVAASLVVYSIFSYVKPLWITLSLELGVLLSLAWGIKTRDKGVRYYSLLVLLISGVRYCVIDNYSRVNNLLEWLLIVLIVAIAYAVYAVYKILKNKSLLEPSEKELPGVLFYSSTFLTVLSIFRYIPGIWISMALGVVGVVLFGIGFLIKDKTCRLGGFIIFAITLGRIVFVDLAGLPIIYKIISFIILGIIFLGVSYLYTRYNIGKK